MPQQDQQQPFASFDAPAKPPQGQQTERAKEGGKPDPKQDADKARQRAYVGQWLKRIKDAKRRAKADFERMTSNIKFARGLQWSSQEHLETPRYICNLTLRAISQGVAMLYAKNPTCDAVRRQRLDYQIWDGQVESLQQANMAIQQSQLMGMEPPPGAVALMQDFQAGEQWKALVNRVGDTLKILSQYYMDSLQPSFKTQMKQLVRRVKTCGVGYVRIKYERPQDHSPSATEVEVTLPERMLRIKALVEQFERGNLSSESPELEELALLGKGLMQSMQQGDTGFERICYDFPKAQSIIIDPSCTSVVGFINADWIAQEYLLPLNDVKAQFEKPDISADNIARYTPSGMEMPQRQADDTNSPSQEQVYCAIYELFHLSSKSTFWVLDGYKDWLLEPDAVTPELNTFWPIYALAFNDVEAIDESGNEMPFYPPSDVDLMRNPQREWNRSREALKKHRTANAPVYLTGAGWLTDSDKEKIANHEDSAVVELQGATPGVNIQQMLAPFQHAQVNPALYDTTPLLQDIQMGAGMQEPNLGAVSPRATATSSTIAEQSRMTITSSNVDDLDDLLSCLAESSGEIILRYFSLETAQRIAGRGATLPQDPAQRADFLNEVYLQVKAASSGRPNKALEVSNTVQLLPLLQAAGANPVGLVELAAKALDEQLDLEKLLPLVPPAPMGPSSNQPKPHGQAPHGAPQAGGQPHPMQPTAPGAPAVPLAGAHQ